MKESFQDVGKKPLLIDMLKIDVKGDAKAAAQLIRRELGIPSGPNLYENFSLLLMGVRFSTIGDVNPLAGVVELPRGTKGLVVIGVCKLEAGVKHSDVFEATILKFWEATKDGLDLLRLGEVFRWDITKPSSLW
ncbi:hypothetical protein EVAR_64677_1 [Eumeta japonica]|uniref:Uncharacterized protein n=1 Tax=Eumeta variegata TaxID=151549 RepID=A0A4C1SWW5_EUMVA|nr:hypothetical protein EVAR_64677_1 [Eumeta japonica]